MNRIRREIEQEQQNKPKKRYRLDWRYMAFKRDTIDGGEYTGKYKNRAIY